MSMTPSKRRSTIRFSFFSTRARMSGVTSKLRPTISVAIETLLLFSENLFAIRGGRNVELVAIFGHGPAGYVNPLVVENLHDFGIRQRLPRVLRIDVPLNLLLDGEAGDV